MSTIGAWLSIQLRGQEQSEEELKHPRRQVDKFHHMHLLKIDGHDPIHPDDHGPPVHADVEFPDEDINDSGEQPDEGMDDPPLDQPSGGQPPMFPPFPPPSNPPVVNVPDNHSLIIRMKPLNK